MSETVLRPLTMDDYLVFFDKPPARSVKGFAGVVDGEVVGIGGLQLCERGYTWAFLNTRVPAASQRRLLVRGARELQRLMRDGHHIVFAIAAEVDCAERFLQWLGFENRGGRVYVWRR